MDEVLEKLGIYDLVGVLLAGINISIFTAILLKVVYGISLEEYLPENETLWLLVMSYFFGVVFQEIGSCFYKFAVYKNSKLLNDVFEGGKNELQQYRLTKNESDEIQKYVKGLLPSGEASSMDEIYNYCRFNMKESSNVRIDKDQSISAFSRSLLVYFGVVAVFLIVEALLQKNIVYLIAAAISVCIIILLGYRCIRFVKLRYAYILRAFYYKVVLGDIKE